jgi:hypothetical protein
MNNKILHRLGICFLIVVGVLSTIATGGGSNGSNPFDPPPEPDESTGGIWEGIQDGATVYAISTDDGLFRWIAWDSGEQGFGTASTELSTLSLSYMQVPSLGATLSDGSESATCSGTGEIEGRVDVAIDLSCTTSEGAEFVASTSLTYSQTYERSSGFSVIAGFYDDDTAVMTVDAGGRIFEQNPVTGCVINGQVSVLDPDVNVYEVALDYANCFGDSAELNGAAFTGLATLDDSSFPEELIIAATGDVGAVTVARSFRLPRN